MKRLLVLGACCALITTLSACSSKSGGSNPVAPNPSGSQQETSAADSALAAGDVAGANAHYQAALTADPSNTQARFGLAVTNVYLVQNDSDVQGIVDYLDTNPINVAPAGGKSPASRMARVAAMLNPSNRSFAPVSEGRAVMKILAMAVTNPPMISDVQRVIQTKVMPKLDEAKGHLAVIEADPDFVFKLPPSITGMTDTLEIDRGDVLLLDAAINGVQGWLGIVMAYNFDVPNNDFKAVRPDSLLAPGTAWAALHVVGDASHISGAAVLAAAKQNLLNVKLRLDAAVTSITAETDDQGNDLVPQDAIATQGFQDMLAGEAKVDQSLRGAISVDATDANQQPFTLEIYAGRFFVPAIQDLKTELPDHTFDVNGDPQLVAPLHFTDPTINGIFPDMTDARWQQLSGQGGPVTARVAR